MPEIGKRSSRRPASEKKSLRGWFFRHRVVLRSVIGVAKALLYLWSIWHRFRDDLWPFYLWIHKVRRCNTRRFVWCECFTT